MGGLAVLARGAGHTVTGCDAGVYPPMSTQLEAQGIRLIEGYDADQLNGLNADLFVIGNVVSRGNPLMEAILDRGLPYVSGPQWLGEHVLNGKWVLGGGRHARQDDHQLDADLAARRRRPQPGLSDRRRTAEFRRVGAAHRFELLRDRSRRVRHRVLRQALEVRPLPAQDGGPEQSRIRSRRHLPGSGRDRNPIPSSDPHRAGHWPGGDERPRGCARARADARLLERSRALRRAGRLGNLAGRRGRAGRRAFRGVSQQRARRRGRVAGAGRTQSYERAGRDRRRAARRRAAGCKPRSRWRAFAM